MTFVRLKNRFVTAFPADDGKERIENGNPQNQHRNRETDQRHTLGNSHQGKDRQQKAEGQRAAIPHKKGGRMEIPAQKAENTADQNQTEHGDDTDTTGIGHHADGQRRDGGNAGGEAVEAVNKIHGVADAHKPQQCNGIAEKTDIYDFIGKRNGEKFQMNPEYHQDHRGDNLSQQFQLRRDVFHIVIKAQRRNEGTTHQKSHHGPGKITVDQESAEKTGVNAETAHARHQPCMHFSGVGFVVNAQFHRQLFRLRRHEDGNDKRGDRRNDYSQHRKHTSAAGESADFFNTISLTHCPFRIRKAITNSG